MWSSPSVSKLPFTLSPELMRARCGKPFLAGCKKRAILCLAAAPLRSTVFAVAPANVYPSCSSFLTAAMRCLSMVLMIYPLSCHRLLRCDTFAISSGCTRQLYPGEQRGWGLATLSEAPCRHLGHDILL